MRYLHNNMLCVVFIVTPILLFTDHPRSGVLYNFSRVCLYVWTVPVSMPECTAPLVWTCNSYRWHTNC